MSMKKNLFLIFSLLLWVPVALPAQVVEKVLDISMPTVCRLPR